MGKNKIYKDLLEVKEKLNGRYPWSFKAPTKDQAHSGYLSAGNDYGSARKVPVGKEKAQGLDQGPIPQQSRCWSPNEVFDHEDKRG